MKVVPEGRSGEPRPESAEGIDDEGTGAESDPLPLSEVFDILSNERRRRVLRVLRDYGGSSTLADVAETIAAWENDKDVSQLTSSERKRTYVGLYQCHLPKMDDSGVITFDKYRGDIQFGDSAPRVFEYLDVEERRPWAGRYLALAGVWSGVFLLGASAGVPALTSPAAIALQVLTFVGCSVAHYHASRDDDDGPPVHADGGGVNP